MKVLLILVLVGVIAADNYCQTSDCKAERRQAWITKGYRHEAASYKKIVEASSCSVCHIDGFTPCHNNGTCIVTGPQNYTCQCPDNTAGKNCETILSCDDQNPCGTDAQCIVFNHKKNCQCPPGYSGDPMVSCTLRTKKATFWGDPHVLTFDNTTYNYMGTCPFYLMKACDSSIDFSIQSTSTILPEWNYNTWTKNLVFHTQGHEFRVDENSIIWLDGVVKGGSYPFYWPAQINATIIATKPSDTVIIQDVITKAVITFIVSLPTNISTVTVEVPLTPFFYGFDAMCGIFGNIDDICNNDIRAVNGSVLTVSNCTVGSNETVAGFADTWIFNSTVDNCIDGAVFFNMSTCNISVAQQKCDLIRQAIDGLGPFGACQQMNISLENLYNDCTYDICNSKDQCGTLDKFAKLCINYLPYADIDDWRSPTFCNYDCPPYSHYSLKTPACQDSCSDPHYSNSSLCHESYQEGCICDQGYYFDSNGLLEGFSFVCRPLDECGCVDGSGNYYPPDTHWLDVNCSAAFECYDGQLTSQPISCSPNGECSNIRGHPTCQCKAGFSGNGLNCTDINECVQDPSTCSADLNQGICTNLPGTYNCTCYAPFTGEQCTEYLPSRHCADILLFHGLNESGVYEVSIGADYSSKLTNAQLTWTEVYCDMESLDGGWTLMTHGNQTSGKTFAEYVRGFGDANSQDLWLGLENIHAMTQSATSLRVIAESCPQDNTPLVDCTYESFSITNSTNQYAVFINSTCKSNSDGNVSLREGWVTWDRTQLGPSFSAFDQDDASNCSNSYYQTGWWYGNRCGIANLNGLHFVCGDNNYAYIGQYLTWDNNPIKNAQMFLRPKEFPHYDSRLN